MKSDSKYIKDLLIILIAWVVGSSLIIWNLDIWVRILGLILIINGSLIYFEVLGLRIRDDIIDELKPKVQE
jgi:hypothetical protein